MASWSPRALMALASKATAARLSVSTVSSLPGTASLTDCDRSTSSSTAMSRPSVRVLMWMRGSGWAPARQSVSARSATSRSSSLPCSW
jgi:hypothetical protein